MPVRAVPLRWLVLMAALVVVPWLVVAATLWWPARTDKPPVPLAAAGPQRGVRDARWGTLDVTPIVISPPLELIGNDWERPGDAGAQWYFPMTTPDASATFFATAGVPRDAVASIMATMRRDPATNGLVFAPSVALIRGLSPEVRSIRVLTTGGRAARAGGEA